MNLSYIVNNLKNIVSKTDIIETLHQSLVSENSDGVVTNCLGYSSMSIDVSAPGAGGRTFKVYIEGRAVSGGRWLRIPVRNQNGVVQPYVYIKNDLYTVWNNLYFADINNFKEVRTRVEWIAGTTKINVRSIISNMEYSPIPATATIRDTGLDTYLNPRATVTIGEQYVTRQGGDSNSDITRNIWIGRPDYAEIVIRNDMDARISVKEIRMFGEIDSDIYNDYTYMYQPDLIIEPGTTQKITSVDYDKLIKYGGLKLRVDQLGWRVGHVATGSFNLKINTK